MKLGQFRSPQAKLVYGVPQGSSLSPLLFNVYLQPLIATLDRMDCCVFNYADDTQLILCLKGSPQSQYNAQCILRFISKWKSSNSLKLNPDKTELVVVKAGGNPWSDLYWPSELGNPPSPLPQLRALAFMSTAISLWSSR